MDVIVLDCYMATNENGQIKNKYLRILLIIAFSPILIFLMFNALFLFALNNIIADGLEILRRVVSPNKEWFKESHQFHPKTAIKGLNIFRDLFKEWLK